MPQTLRHHEFFCSDHVGTNRSLLAALVASRQMAKRRLGEMRMYCTQWHALVKALVDPGDVNPCALC